MSFTRKHGQDFVNVMRKSKRTKLYYETLTREDGKTKFPENVRWAIHSVAKHVAYLYGQIIAERKLRAGR